MKKASKKQNLKTILLGLLVLAVVAGLVFAVIFVFKGDPEKKKATEQTAYMEDLGKEFYTELFYKQLDEGRSKEELKDFLKKYEEIGINTNLDNLSRTAGNDNKKKIEELLSAENKCDKEKTKVFIYPKAPYGKNDFTLKVELSCGDKKKDDAKKDEPTKDQEKKNDEKNKSKSSKSDDK